MSKVHFVLVHGAYHTSWHMHFVKDKLEEVGYDVTTPQLPSAAEDPIGGTLEGDTAVVKTALEHAAENADIVIPLFHSYAGIPGSEAVAELSDFARAKISRLVYLAAFIIDQGTSLTAPSGGKTAPWAVREGDVLSVPDPVPTFFADVEPGLAEEACKHLVKQAYEPMAANKKHAGWRLFPVTYVRCTEEKALPVKRIDDKLAEIQADKDLASKMGRPHH